MQAVGEYLADAKARELADATLYKLEIQLRKQLLSWCKAEGYKLLKEFDLRAAQSFRASWTDGGLAKKKKQERLTGFFWFCIRAGWLTANPTDRLGRISVTQAPTDYFTRDEYDKLIDSTYLYREGRGASIGGNNGTRIRALIMLMRWSGLRIRDAVTLERTRLINDNLLLYQAKTGTPVYVPLPPQVAEALRTLPEGAKPNPRYFFWSGNGLPKSAVADWQRSFRRVFKLAGLEKPDGSAKRCFPHMLRDTFAVEMLLAGVPIDQVSMLLGPFQRQNHGEALLTLGEGTSRPVGGERSQRLGLPRGKSLTDSKTWQDQVGSNASLVSGRLAAVVNADQHTLRNAKVLITAFACCFAAAPPKDARFTVEETAHRLLADMPQLGHLWD